ncbi:polysaccharide deacetylase family protein [Saccharopolyspora sp. NFXS83]|uniref:polysaccharide deacetylase family protein n=1 Tax=Saccharopolyspora sp. NFXS83 TaxID=2993560 RepID=UPI00224B2206|nr:polysaccharide deacetylase family protein [Saccharopolyspora sp. NFXS83]MCX2730005.1 polysaccharide deacetylase family protein [Saccharopolyspora sp. NFXS83]
MTRTAQQPSRRRVPQSFPYVLMYHSVSEYTDDPYLVTVEPARFERQLRWLRARGCTGVSMRELLAARREGRGRGLVGLTFDDAYTDFSDTVYPLLRRYGWTATVFVISGMMGGHNAWDPAGPRKSLMTEDEVARVAAGGMEIGSHSVGHRRLTELDPVELAAEVGKSRPVLQALSGQPVNGFCYPYGDVDAAVVGSVREAGYDYGCAIWRSEFSGVHALPRTYVGDRDGTVRLDAKRARHGLAATRAPEIPAPRFLRFR